LLTGPPISTDIIPPKTIPKRILLVPPIELSAPVIPVFIDPIIGFMNNIITPIKNVPSNGYKNTGFIPSKLFGKPANNFLRPTTKYPAMKPASNAPKKPPETAGTFGSNALAKVTPALAKAPPTKPIERAGLSPILIAINPARTGNINPNAVPPIFFKTAANGVPVPKPLGLAGLNVSNKNAKAINIPPPITNGNICDTPFIRCL